MSENRHDRHYRQRSLGSNMSVEPIISKRRARALAWNAAAIDTLLQFRQRFPQTFARLNDRRRRPLKIGIRDDITAAIPDLAPIEIGRALRLYCSDLRYHRACIDGADRIDLDGNVAGAVTTAQAENAKATIAGIEAKLAQRRRRSATSAPAAPPAPKRLSLADLRAAAAARKPAMGA
jgi:sRNA-binding protein